MHLAVVHDLHKEENRLKVSRQDDQLGACWICSAYPTHKESHSEGPVRSTYGTHPCLLVSFLSELKLTLILLLSCSSEHVTDISTCPSALP